MFILAIIYFLVGLFYVLREIEFISKTKKFYMVSVFRVMYAFIYGFFPAIFLYRIYNGTTSLSLIVDEQEYVINLSFILLISIIEYVIFNLFYKATKESKFHSKEFPTISNNAQKIALTIMIFFGIISLLLWTRAFGSIWNFIVNADAVRANYSDIYNPFAFMEHFTKVFIVIFFVSISLFMHEKRENKGRIYTFLLMLVSLFFSLVVMMCTDSRGTIATLIVVVALYYFNERIANSGLDVKKAIWRIVIIVFIAFIAIIMSEGVMKGIRGSETNTAETEDSGIIQSIEGEFGYALQSQVAVVNEMYEKPMQYMIVNDVVGALFAWLPSRFIPFELPIDIWDYNTEILNTYQHSMGQSPTDFVTTSLYMFGWTGIIILPALFGVFLKKLDTLLRRTTYSPYLMALYARFMYYSMWWVSHLSIRYTTLALFGMFLVHIALMFFYKLIDKKGRLN